MLIEDCQQIKSLPQSPAGFGCWTGKNSENLKPETRNCESPCRYESRLNGSSRDWQLNGFVLAGIKPFLSISTDCQERSRRWMMICIVARPQIFPSSRKARPPATSGIRENL